jgi:hypothetical protein
MNQLVILNLGKGDCQQGCPTIAAQLWMGDGIPPMQMTGILPAVPELDSLYLRWQRLYEALSARRNWRQFREAESDFEFSDFEIEDDESYITDVSEVEFQQICQEIRHRLNSWLNTESCRNID